jgi:hypothetical protein
VHDVEVRNGGVLALPHDTNIAVTREVLVSKRLTERRISVKVRAFSPETFISAEGGDETKARQDHRLILLNTERRLPAE